MTRKETLLHNPAEAGYATDQPRWRAFHHFLTGLVEGQLSEPIDHFDGTSPLRSLAVVLWIQYSATESGAIMHTRANGEACAVDESLFFVGDHVGPSSPSFELPAMRGFLRWLPKANDHYVGCRANKGTYFASSGSH